MRQFTKLQKLLTAATSGQASIRVEDFESIVLAFNTATSANLTVKVQGSIADTAPDFTASSSPTNQWDYVQIKDLEDGSSVDGDTGFSVSGTDDQRHFEVNVNTLTWLSVIVTTRSAGTVTVTAKAARVGAN